jgi:hypothetical protein
MSTGKGLNKVYLASVGLSGLNIVFPLGFMHPDNRGLQPRAPQSNGIVPLDLKKLILETN